MSVEPVQIGLLLPAVGAAGIGFTVAVVEPAGNDLEARAVRHTLACLLARCIGRSPLEYLAPASAANQANAASAMMDNPPPTIPNLIDSFLFRIA